MASIDKSFKDFCNKGEQIIFIYNKKEIIETTA